MQVAPEDTAIIIEGQIPLGDTGKYFWVPVQDPALYFGRAFRAALLAGGVTVDGDVVVDRTAQSAEPSRTLYVHYSPPLSEIVAVMNKESDNYLAEYVLRATSYHSPRGTVDRRAGVQAVTNFLVAAGNRPARFLPGRRLRAIAHGSAQRARPVAASDPHEPLARGRGVPRRRCPWRAWTGRWRGG